MTIHRTIAVTIALGILTTTASAADWFQSLSSSAQANILWRANHENRNTCQWNDSSCNPWASGPGKYSWQIVTSPVHSGAYALSSTIDTRNGTAGVRWPRRWTNDARPRDGLPTEAFYSCWCYFPKTFSSAWYNLMQWKSNTSDGQSSDPLWSIDPVLKSDGHMYLTAYSHVGDDGRYDTLGSGSKAVGAYYIVPGKWFHLECFYKFSKTKTGRLICWLDDVQQLDLNNIQTQYNRRDSSYPRQWAVNTYGNNITPSPHTLIIDDAAISNMRLGN